MTGRKMGPYGALLLFGVMFGTAVGLAIIIMADRQWNLF